MRAVLRPRPLLAVVGLVLALIGAEWTARAAARLPPRPEMTDRAYPFGLLVPDEAAGFAMPPGLHLPAEGLHTNALGLRDRPREDEERGAFRIALLGDDVAAGRGVTDEQVWTRLLEDALAASDPGARPIEVWNLGVPGYGVENALLHFQALQDRVRPNLVVLAYHLADDPLDDLLGPAHVVPYDGDVVAAPWRPAKESEYTVERAHALRPTLEWSLPFDEPLLRRSALYRSLSRRAAARLFRGAAQVPWGVEPFDFQAFGGYAWLWLDPEPEPIETAWSITDHLLTRVRGAAEEGGAELVVVSVPARFDADPVARAAALEQGWTQRDAGDTRLRDDATRLAAGTPGRRLAHYCEAHEIDLIDLLPGLTRAQTERPRYYEDLPTWNADGHRAAARLLGRALIERRLVPRGERDPVQVDLLLADSPTPAPRRFDGGFRPDRRRSHERVRWEAVHRRAW